MVKYITIIQASKIANIRKTSAYKALRRGALRYKMIKGQRFTTEDWLNDYMCSRNDRQRVHFQGKPCYSWTAGEWSVKMVATYLQRSVNTVHFLIRTGKLKSFRRGSYHVILKDSVMELMQSDKYSLRKNKNEKIVYPEIEQKVMNL